MLNRDEQVTPIEKIISDNLTHKPSVATSAWNNLAAGIATAPYAIQSFDEEYRKSPEGKTAAATFEALKRGNENPETGWTQWGINEVSNMIGQGLNPITWMLGEVGGLAIKPLTAGLQYLAPKALVQWGRKPITEMLSEPVSKYIPSMIGKKGEGEILSSALFGKKVAQGFGVGAGVMLPQATLDNFNVETGKHDILGIAESMGMGGIFGMGISTIPFAWGILKANINRARGRAPTHSIDDLEMLKALDEGHIDKQTYDLWRAVQDYQEQPESRADNKQKLAEKTTKYVAEQGHSVDQATNMAHFEILNRDQIDNLQSATVDQLVADYIPDEHKNALTDFTVQAGIDDMRNNPNLLDGVRGYVEHMDQNLLAKDEVLANADQLVDEHLKVQELYRGVQENKFGYKTLEEAGVTEKELQKHDLELGKGYWYAESEEHAKKYGKEIQKAKGHFKIFDVEKDYDKDISPLYEEINNRRINGEILKFPKPEGYITTQKLINEMQAKLKKKGYEGVRRFGNTGMDAARYEIMLFEKPLDLEKSLPFDQNSIYKIAKEHGQNNHLPLVVPDEVERLIKQESRIEALERKNQKLFDKYEKSGNKKYLDEMQANNAKVEELKAEKINLKSPVEELQSIKDDLIKENKLRKDFETRKSFQRLNDLAEVWHPAKTLLDRVNLEDAINKQEGYRDIAKTMLQIADGNIAQMANRGKVNGYMEARVNPRIDDNYKPSVKEPELKEANKVPVDHEIILAEQDKLIEERGEENGKKEYEVAKEKFNEFKKFENVFNNLIKCQLGSQK